MSTVVTLLGAVLLIVVTGYLFVRFLDREVDGALERISDLTEDDFHSPKWNLSTPPPHEKDLFDMTDGDLESVAEGHPEILVSLYSEDLPIPLRTRVAESLQFAETSCGIMETLQRAARDEYAMVRNAALTGLLGHLGSPLASPILEELSKDAHADIAYVAKKLTERAAKRQE